MSTDRDTSAKRDAIERTAAEYRRATGCNHTEAVARVQQACRNAARKRKES
jgi:hypothetical protein